jgi:hypothetical protein
MVVRRFHYTFLHFSAKDRLSLHLLRFAMLFLVHFLRFTMLFSLHFS